MKKIIFTTLSLLFIIAGRHSFAGDLSFYMIYPNGDGDMTSAQPYLAEFFGYINEATGIPLSGLYLNDKTEATSALKEKKFSLAIVSPEFFDEFGQPYNLSKVLLTIPEYSSGPYERYYIMANEQVDVPLLVEQGIQVNLFASKSHDAQFLSDQVFVSGDQIKKIAWILQETPDVLGVIKKISAGDDKTFVLLTGYEFSVITKLKSKNAEFAKLKLVYTSRSLPSAPLVTAGDIDSTSLAKIREALLNMPNTLRGNTILKKLRLKGFSQL